MLFAALQTVPSLTSLTIDCTPRCGFVKGFLGIPDLTEVLSEASVGAVLA
jgi:hypothetical protein